MLRTLVELSTHYLARLRPTPRPTPVDPKSLILLPAEAATATRQPEGALLVRWEAQAATTQVIVRYEPEGGAVVSSLTVSARQAVSLTGLDSTRRPYIELRFAGGTVDGQRLFVAERFLPLSSVANVRDIGGYPTATGRQVRWGQLYRSGALHQLRAEDGTYLEELGLRQIRDWRTEKEVATQPNRLPPGLQTLYRHTPLYRRDRILRGLKALIFKRNQFDEILRTGYLRAIDEKATVFGDWLRRLAEPDNRPQLIHCTAGKDRTGMACALLLRLLGVPEATIVADYTLSNYEYDAFEQAAQPNIKHLRRLGITPAQIRPILLADPATMRTMLAHIRQQYGSVARYAITAAGLDERVIENLREQLLTTERHDLTL